MGKANFPENAALAKQSQTNVKQFHSLPLPLSGSSKKKKFKGIFKIGGRLVAAWPTAKDIVSGPLIQPQRSAQKPDH